jgi:ketosteroid isomerase-like protein
MTNEANKKLVQEYLEIAAVTDDIDRATKLFTDDCVYVLSPGGYTFRGARAFAMFAKTWGGERTHDKTHKINITKWFSDDENLCIEYTHGFNSLFGLPIKIKNATTICLVFHTRDGKFDSLHEYIDTGGVLKSLLASIILGIMVWWIKMKLSKNSSTK